MKQEDNYKMQSLRILSEFQLLEFSLKIYIATTYGIIRHALDGILTFKYRYDDIKNAPLERLLPIFQKINSNESLQRCLNRLKEERNHVAHRALILTEPSICEILDESFEARHASLDETEKELDECLKIMSKELQLIQDIYSKHTEA